MQVNNFVGGYAGSGTRVIQMMLEQAGVLARTEDFPSPTYDEHYTLSYFMTVARKYIATDIKIDEQFTRDFLEKFEQFRSGKENWSLKNGETMWCIPFLHRLFSHATYILVVRNGVDNILNNNKFSEMYSRIFVYTDAIYKTQNFSLWGHRMIFWNEIHRRAIEEGKKFFGDRFLIVRLEDIIRHPKKEGKKVFDHLGLDFKTGYVDFVENQKSIGKHERRWVEGRWGGHIYKPQIHLDNLIDLGAEMLTELRYI